VRRRATATTAIKHPGIVEVFDFGYMASGHAYLIIKVLDFGIAKLTDPGLAAGSATRTGAVMGTPTYMSPEQCRGTGEVDLRADLYSIGCILYELVTGRPPFNPRQRGRADCRAPVPRPRATRAVHPRLSQETEALIMALLAKPPEHRVQSANDLAQHLTQITGVPEPIFFGALTMIASFVRVAGVLLVIVPACIGLSFRREPDSGLAELAWGLVLVVGVSDYVIRPRLVRGETKVPALVTLRRCLAVSRHSDCRA
jgi:hypothetical protein